jgi:hypothetical protein
VKTRKTVIKGSLVTSSLIRETTENESANAGYRFGQEEETYNIVAKIACDLNSQEFMEKLGELSGSLSLRKKDFKKI